MFDDPTLWIIRERDEMHWTYQDEYGVVYRGHSSVRWDDRRHKRINDAQRIVDESCEEAIPEWTEVLYQETSEEEDYDE